MAWFQTMVYDVDKHVLKDVHKKTALRFNGLDGEQMSWPCGCEQRGQRFYLCDYHTGYADAVRMMKVKV